MSERDEGFLARWSRRKHEATREDAPDAAAPAVAADSANMPAPSPATTPPPEAPQEPAPLPPVDSLTFESDFTPFMAKGVDPDVQREAIKKLVRDERFNVMDGLDVYIDDYTKPAPIPPEWYGKMAQLARLGDWNASPEAQEERRRAAEGAAGAREEASAALPEDASSAPADAAGETLDQPPDEGENSPHGQ